MTTVSVSTPSRRQSRGRLRADASRAAEAAAVAAGRAVG